MSDRVQLGQQAKRTGLAALVAALVFTGAAWGGRLATQATTSQTVSAAAAPAVHPVTGTRESYADIVKIVAPSVVTIHVESKAQMSPTNLPDDDMFRRFFGDPFGDQSGRQGTPRGGNRVPHAFRQRGLGSGVVVTNDGYILTNHHVVDGADNITVDVADGRSLKAKVIGTDEKSDLAVIKVDASGLQAMALGNSDAVEVGDVVLAVGNPLGVGQTVTMGIVSAKGRSTNDGNYEDFIQTDAPINQGNSGGALVNLKGELVGVNSQIMSNSGGNIGIGFAIPTNMARHVMDDLRKDGKVHRAQLGVTIQPVTADMAESLGLKEAKGAIVSSVEPGSAADHAGVKKGDVIKSFNGMPVSDINALRNRVADTAPGTSAPLVVIRDSSERTLTVKLAEASADKSARRDGDDPAGDKTALGVSVAPLTPQLAERAGLPKDAHGLLVQDVDPNGRAADAGIQAGDVIQEVNRKTVETIDDLRSAVRTSSNKPALVLVHRGDRDLFITVRPS
jgi:Do/DeqQ family serine protease